MRRTGLFAGVLSAAMLAWAPPAGAGYELSASPGLYPRYRPGISDYVVRCSSPQTVRLKVDAHEERVRVGSREPRVGTFTVKMRRRPGQVITVKGDTTHYIRCLPRSFPRWKTERSGTPQAQWYAITPVGKRPRGYAAIFNWRGVPMWWRRSTSYRPWDAKVLPGGSITWTRNRRADPFGLDESQAYEERRLDGRLVRRIRAVGVPTDTHDLTRLPNGNSYVIAYRPRSGADLRRFGGPRDATVFDAEIQEVTPSGAVVWSWNSKEHIAPSETAPRWWRALHRAAEKRGRGYDLVHANSVEPDGDGVIVSARHVDAVYRINRLTGLIDWKLGGSQRPESLLVLGDGDLDNPTFGGQHDARLYGDGSLTVFDNGADRGRPPRALRFAIDPLSATAVRVEQVWNPVAPLSFALGSARKLPGGNWVVCWGGSSLVTEQTPGGETVLSMLFDDAGSYRAAPVPPGELSASAVRRGMSRMTSRLRGDDG
jgi:hypothetical protein